MQTGRRSMKQKKTLLCCSVRTLVTAAHCIGRQRCKAPAEGRYLVRVIRGKERLPVRIENALTQLRANALRRSQVARRIPGFEKCNTSTEERRSNARMQQIDACASTSAGEHVLLCEHTC
eukprot:6200316-Pleurochrysis_carterae.AAC.4